MTQCTHNITEREVAVTADGYCPLCQATQIARLRTFIQSLDGKTIAIRCEDNTFIDDGIIVAADIIDEQSERNEA